MRLGVIGYGAIGREVVSRFRAGDLGRASLVAVLVRQPRPAEADLLVTHEPDRFFDQADGAANRHGITDHGNNRDQENQHRSFSARRKFLPLPFPVIGY